MAKILKLDKDLLVADKQTAAGSCRFCLTGMGKHQVIDAEKQEVFLLCDKHKDDYKIDKDDIQANLAIAEKAI